MGQWTVAGCSGWLVEEEVLVAVNHDTCGIKAHSIVALVMMALWVVGCGISVQLSRELCEEGVEEEASVVIVYSTDLSMQLLTILHYSIYSV